METCHKDDCAFKEKHSPSEFVDPFKETNEVEKKVQKLEISKFYQRLESKEIAQKLTLRLNEEFLKEIEQELDYYISIAETRDLTTPFVIISLFFWDLEEYKYERTKISCQHCQVQRFLKKDEAFHPAREHRWWCPTVCKKVEPCGWKFILSGLKDEIILPKENTSAYEKVKFETFNTIVVVG
jgi:hypothetical protein